VEASATDGDSLGVLGTERVLGVGEDCVGGSATSIEELTSTPFSKIEDAASSSSLEEPGRSSFSC